MKKTLSLIFGIIVLLSCNEKTIKNYSDQEIITLIFEEANSSKEAHQNLKYLCENFPKRLACYPQGIEAAKWTKQIMEQMDIDKVFLQEAQVVNWKRGAQEVGIIKLNEEEIRVNVCALGRGIATPDIGIEALVVEVDGIEGLNLLTKKQVAGKIVFFNKAMNPNYENPFRAYGETVGQRFVGPKLAAEYGAVGTIIRSLNTAIDEFPHTGVTEVVDDSGTVPAVCISTKHANILSDMLKENAQLKFYFKTDCENKADTISYNAIGEITGTEFPNEFISVGGHLDSWDNSPGAHDDGGGCMQSIEVLRIFKKIGYSPKRSIRAVMFMDEEISQGGGKAYLEQAKLKGEKHIFAIESDRGVTTPSGFTFDTDSLTIEKIAAFKELFVKRRITVFEKGYGGVDINPLKEIETPLAGLVTDPTHYFEWHHSANDTFDQVDREEMQKGAAAMAALIYLIDKYGLE